MHTNLYWKLFLIINTSNYPRFILTIIEYLLPTYLAINNHQVVQKRQYEFIEKTKTFTNNFRFSLHTFHFSGKMTNLNSNRLVGT